MKIYLLIFLSSILIVIKVNCQLNLFVTGGINYCNLLTTLLPPPYDESERVHFHYTIEYSGGIGIGYSFNKWNVYSGLGLSYRGTEAINLYVMYFGQSRYFTYTFAEIPLIITKNIFNQNLEIGGGAIYTIRVGENVRTVGDEHEIYGVDLKAVIKYKIFRRFSVEGSYLLGNFDKYVFNKTDNYMHSDFGINLNYSFYLSNGIK